MAQNPDTSQEAGPAKGTASPLPRQALAGLVWLHRWSGVILCLFFALWFATGAVMVFVPFPSLSSADQAAHAPTFDPGQIRIAPAEAFRLAGGGDGLRIISFAGRPAYVASRGGAPPVVIAGDDGSHLQPLSGSDAAVTARTFGGGAIRNIEGPLQYDQWIAHQQFDPLRPLFRVSLADRDGTTLYVSARTGEVVQQTKLAQRAWNWVGSVVHWIYFTPLRKSFTAWDQTVWWVSLAGLATTLAGLFLGVLRTAQSAARRRRVSPFRGWMEWHHILGLMAGLFVLTWIFSGWLSMDHGRLFSRGEAPAAVAARFEGLPLSEVVARISPSDLRGLGPASKITFGAIGGQAIAVGVGGASPASRAVLAGSGGAPVRLIPASIIANAVEAGWPGGRGGVRPVPPNDFYAAAEGMPASTVVMQAGGSERPQIYVDAADGRLVTVMDRSRAAYAWVYYGLHTFRLPGLIERPTMWAAIILAPITLGFCFSVTGLVISFARLRRTMRP